jgi:hypothetical protein
MIGPIILIQANQISLGVQLHNLSKDPGFGLSSFFASVSSPSLQVLPQPTRLNLPAVNNISSSTWGGQQLDPQVVKHLHKTWQRKPASLKEEPT